MLVVWLTVALAACLAAALSSQFEAMTTEEQPAKGRNKVVSALARQQEGYKTGAGRAWAPGEGLHTVVQWSGTVRAHGRWAILASQQAHRTSRGQARWMLASLFAGTKAHRILDHVCWPCSTACKHGWTGTHEGSSWQE